MGALCKIGGYKKSGRMISREEKGSRALVCEPLGLPSLSWLAFYWWVARLSSFDQGPSAVASQVLPHLHKWLDKGYIKPPKQGQKVVGFSVWMCLRWKLYFLSNDFFVALATPWVFFFFMLLISLNNMSCFLWFSSDVCTDFYLIQSL